MIEATSNLPPFPSYVLITLAQREARLAVKEQLRARGLKPQYMRVSEINRAADIYLKANARELLEEAWRKCQGSADLMRFYEKEQRERKRALERNLEHSCNSQSPANRALPLNETHAHNGAQR